MEAGTLVRCAIYTRLAASDPNSAVQLAEQRLQAEAFITAHAADGLTILPERYDDEGQSGNSAGRPALNRLRWDIEAGKVNYVVVDQYYRLARDEALHVELCAFFRRHGVNVIVTTATLASFPLGEP